MTSTVPYAEVIGDPIAHSKSPVIHRFWLEKLGMRADYRSTKVNQNELADFFAERRRDADWRGCNITMPLKVVALPLAERVSEEARLVKATNCIVPDGDGSIFATNTDVDGVREALRSGFDRQTPSTNRVDTKFDLIGTGGAARAALAVLSEENVTIFGRDLAKARALSEEFGLSGDGHDSHIDTLARAPSDASNALDGKPHRGATQRYGFVLINATSLGMHGHPPLDIRLDAYPGDSVVIDMVYNPLETALLKEAWRLGMVTVDGLVMLIGQAARAFELFFGRPAPREHDAELRRLLAA